MIVYEVELTIDVQIAQEYRRWLDRHVRDMLALPGFTGAELWERIDPPPPAERVVLVAQYRLADRISFDRYLAEHAPRMREEGLRRFGGRFEATRRLLAPVP
ncbi:MAG: DUF4286 family protein [Lysobacterales bacterium]